MSDDTIAEKPNAESIIATIKAQGPRKFADGEKKPVKASEVLASIASHSEQYERVARVATELLDNTQAVFYKNPDRLLSVENDTRVGSSGKFIVKVVVPVDEGEGIIDEKIHPVLASLIAVNDRTKEALVDRISFDNSPDADRFKNQLIEGFDQQLEKIKLAAGRLEKIPAIARKIYAHERLDKQETAILANADHDTAEVAEWYNAARKVLQAKKNEERDLVRGALKAAGSEKSIDFKETNQASSDINLIVADLGKAHVDRLWEFQDHSERRGENAREDMLSQHKGSRVSDWEGFVAGRKQEAAQKGVPTKS